uniref:hypothetical protein n=1 Tax=Acetatifactor sp. TaxID=1872090 RepID=UPI0040575455
MSYDIYLKEPITGEVASVPGHLMIGGTYKADYYPEIGIFIPALNTKAHLNVTYNYGQYYKEMYEKGIRQIYGLSGVDSISILENMISTIANKYKQDDEWISTKRTKVIYYDEEGNELENILVLLKQQIPAKEEVIEYEVNEGDTSNYWLATAANAIRPLHQLIALAKMRPDCIWDGD